MRVPKLVCSLIVVALSVMSQSSALAQVFYVDTEALVWDREQDRNGRDLFNGADQLNTGIDLPFSHDWGYRLTFGWENADWGLQGVYSRIDTWRSTASGTLANELDFDLDGPGTNTLNFVNGITGASVIPEELNGGGAPILTDDGLLAGATFTMTNATELQDIQFNLRRRHARMNWIKDGVGVRHIILDDVSVLSIQGTFDDDQVGVNGIGELTHAALTSTVAGVPGLPLGFGGGLTLLSGAANGFIDDDATPLTSLLALQFTADVSNHMTGVHYLADLLFYEGRHLVVQGNLRAGVFHNRIASVLTETYSELNLDNSVYGRTFRDKKDTVSLAANVGMTFSWKIRDDVRIFAGYEVLFLSGVALAVDQWEHVQIDNFGNHSYRIGTSTFTAHGGTGGFEFRW